MGNKNFEIISISLETDKKSWVKAIAEVKIICENISDLKGQQNLVTLLCGMQTIPANFLINPAGIIMVNNIIPAEIKK